VSQGKSAIQSTVKKIKTHLVILEEGEIYYKWCIKL